MVREVLREAEERGHTTDLKLLGDLRIGPLQDGGTEGDFGVAEPKDDMEAIYPSLGSMGAFVFGTPIRFGRVSDRAEIFIDCLIRYSAPDKPARLPRGIPAVVIITYEWDNLTAYDDVVGWVRSRLEG